MDTLDILVQARELISCRENWTQRDYAIDADGQMVDWSDDDAYSFCSLGAIYRASDSDAEARYAARHLVTTRDEALLGYQIHHNAAEILARCVQWNDHSTHADVLAVFDAAIDTATK